MARTTISPQTIIKTGLALSYTNIAAADGVALSPLANFICKNTTGSPITLTFLVTQTVDGLTVSNKTVSLPANTIMSFGNFEDGYKQSDGMIYMNVSGNGVQIAALTV